MKRSKQVIPSELGPSTPTNPNPTNLMPINITPTTRAPQLLGGCAGTQFGCCPGSSIAASGPRGQGCPTPPIPPRPPKPPIGGCEGTRYGCCPGSTIEARGPYGEGCSPDLPSRIQEVCCGQRKLCRRGEFGCFDGSGLGICDNTSQQYRSCQQTKGNTPCLKLDCPDGETEVCNRNSTIWECTCQPTPF